MPKGICNHCGTSTFNHPDVRRKQVLRRDNYICKICNKKKKAMNVDHIKPFLLFPKLRFDVNNGRTLCEDCHRKTPTYGRRIDKIKEYIQKDLELNFKIYQRVKEVGFI